MPTVNENLADTATRHTVYLHRWSTGTYRRQLNLIDQSIADLTYKLSIRSPADNSITAARLRAMLKESKKVSVELYAAINSAVNGDYKDLAAYESRFQVGAIQAAYPIELSLTAIPPAQLYAATMSQPFRGRILRDWWASQSVGFRGEVDKALRIGFVEGESISQISSRFRTVGKKAKRDMEAVIRTATNHMSSVARKQTTMANEEIFSHEEWVSTLDGRTSAICIDLDNKRFKVGKGQYPPAHFNCRSTRVPVTKSWEELGFDDMDEDAPLSNRPFVADKRRVRDIPKSQRDSVIGTTSARTYSDFAKSQPLSFFQDVAGSYRGELAKKGTLPLKALVRNGQWMTIEQIEASESKAIKAAVRKAFG